MVQIFLIYVTLLSIQGTIYIYSHSKTFYGLWHHPEPLWVDPAIIVFTRKSKMNEWMNETNSLANKWCMLCLSFWTRINKFQKIPYATCGNSTCSEGQQKQEWTDMVAMNTGFQKQLSQYLRKKEGICRIFLFKKGF